MKIAEVETRVFNYVENLTGGNMDWAKRGSVFVFNNRWAVICSATASIATLNTVFRLRYKYDRVTVVIPVVCSDIIAFEEILKSWGIGLLLIKPFCTSINPKDYVIRKIQPLSLSHRR